MQLSGLRRDGTPEWLRPDGKVQVGVEYEGRRPVRIHSIAVTTAHAADAPELEELRALLGEALIEPAFEDEEIVPDAKTRIFVNPEGRVVGGGPGQHSGLTGRKTSVDTYGEYCRVSEKALSGKDPLRIDRTGAYAARHAAVNLVRAGLAEECEVLLSYGIGFAEPVSLEVDSYGTGKLDDAVLAQLLREHLDFRPGGILKAFGLRDLPAAHAGDFYSRLSAFGHMGRTDMDPPWERADKAGALTKAAKKK